MKRDTFNNITHFFFKYIWIICVILIATEIIFTFGTANTLMQQSSKDIMQSVCGEVSGRVDGVLRLIQGLAKDERISDTSSPLFDRAVLCRPYQESYGLYMIALTDENVNVVSCDETEPPKETTSLAYREYMQKLYASGEYQITDAFVAGADHSTMNYTIAVPIIKDNVVKGSVFGSIYFNEIQNIIEQSLGDDNRHFYLLGKENTIMAGNDSELIEKSFFEATNDLRFFGESAQEVNDNMLNGVSGNYWELENGSLWYVNYQKVPSTNWTLAFRVEYSSIFYKLLPGVIGKIIIYILMCIVVYYLGTKYMNRNLNDVNHLLVRMSSMQKEIFQSECANYDELIDLTKSGLTDQLTGLATRIVLFNRAEQIIGKSSLYGSVLFIDLDDLKSINDIYGHEAGDCAIIHFAKVLKQYANNCNSVAARYGGDEFIFMLEDTSEAETIKLVEKILIECNTKVKSNEKEFEIHASIGVSYYPRHGKTLEELISKADLALYIAKQAGKNCYEVYSEYKK